MSSKSRAVQRRDQQMQQQQAARAHDYEIHEAEASASAQAGLNLNIFAALSGSMFSRSKKTADTKADGSSHSVEERETAAVAHGKGHGNMAIMGQGKANAKTRDIKARGAQQIAQQQQTDHLGIEG